MNDNRPVNLALTTLSFPPMAIVSILHRISGLVMFILLPYMLCLLERSLASSDSFSQVVQTINEPLIKLSVFGFVGASIYHILAGIRHLLMDIGIGESLFVSKLTAIFVIGLAIILVLLTGIYLW